MRLGESTTWLLAVLAAMSTAEASETGFDTLVEGQGGATFTDGGVTFSNLDLGIGPGVYAFHVEQADASLGGMSGFGAPNALGFLGYSPGPFAVFTRVKSFDFANGSVVTSAGLEVFESGSSPGNTISLEAYSLGVLVASQMVTIPPGSGVHHFSLAVGGAAFDSVHVVGNGNQDQGSFKAVIDGVYFGSLSAGTIYCAGDGSAAACPCGNASTIGAGEGCSNSFGQGALLRAQGPASLASDGVVLACSQMPNAPALYYQGTAPFLSGTGAAFGDGLRCVGGTIVRLGTKPNVGGASQYPDVGEASVSVRGLITAPGTRDYQCWYRNAAAFCTNATYNLSNGLEILWVP